jgi:hypothetical protein
MEIMGYYSLANSIANAALLGINAIAWVLYPGLLARLGATIETAQVKTILREFSQLYCTVLYLIVFCAIGISPLVFLLLPEYVPAIPILNVLLLCQSILGTGFSMSVLAIARNKHMHIAAAGLFTFAAVAASALVLAFSKTYFVFLVIPNLAGSIIFTLLVGWVGSRLILRITGRYVKTIAQLFPLRYLVPIAFVVIGNLWMFPTLCGILALATFVALNVEDIRSVRAFLVARISSGPQP